MDVYKKLNTKGNHPALHVPDNEYIKAVKHYITSKNTYIQLVEPHSHRMNAAELAVKSTKHHTIANLTTLDPNCPI